MSRLCNSEAAAEAAALNILYKPFGFSCENFFFEKESSDYSAATFLLADHRILYRVSKITPTKTGQFVTLWKRINAGPIQPFDSVDPIDFVIINVRSDNNSGQFIFPKKILCEKNIFSKNNRGGKRAMRIYAPWDEVNSKQARNTQQWQANFFIDFNNKKIQRSAHRFYEILNGS